MREIRHKSMSQVVQRANVLHNAWLRGLNQAGHTVTAQEIKEAFLAAVSVAEREACKADTLVAE